MLDDDNKIHACLIIALFFFNDTATTEIYTLSLHDALPIYSATAAKLPIIHDCAAGIHDVQVRNRGTIGGSIAEADRKSTRLNSSHSQISYALFCLTKKNTKPSATSSLRLLEPSVSCRHDHT